VLCLHNPTLWEPSPMVVKCRCYLCHRHMCLVCTVQWTVMGGKHAVVVIRSTTQLWRKICTNESLLPECLQTAFFITCQVIQFRALKLVKEEPHKFADGRPTIPQKFLWLVCRSVILNRMRTYFKGWLISESAYMYTSVYTGGWIYLECECMTVDWSGGWWEGCEWFIWQDIEGLGHQNRTLSAHSEVFYPSLWYLCNIMI